LPSKRLASRRMGRLHAVLMHDRAHLQDDTPNVQEAAVEKESADKGEDKASKANSGKSGKNKK